MLFCLVYRVIPAILIYYNVTADRTLLDNLCDGLFMSILTMYVGSTLVARGSERAWLMATCAR